MIDWAIIDFKQPFINLSCNRIICFISTCCIHFYKQKIYIKFIVQILVHAERQPLTYCSLFTAICNTLCNIPKTRLKSLCFLSASYLSCISVCNLCKVDCVIMKFSFCCKSSIIVRSTIVFFIRPLCLSLPNTIYTMLIISS